MNGSPTATRLASPNGARRTLRIPRPVAKIQQIRAVLILFHYGVNVAKARAER